MEAGSPCVTDGCILVYRKHSDPKLYARLERMAASESDFPKRATGRLVARRMREQWLKGRAYRVEMPGVEHSPAHGFVFPFLTLKSGPKHAWIDKRLWDIARAAAAFDEVRWARKFKAPLRLMKRGKLVGLLMGLRPPEER